VSWLRHDFVITHFHTSSERQSAIWTKTGEPMTALPIKEEGDTTIWQEFNSTVTGYSHNPLSQSDKHPVTNCCWPERGSRYDVALRWMQVDGTRSTTTKRQPVPHQIKLIRSRMSFGCTSCSSGQILGDGGLLVHCGTVRG